MDEFISKDTAVRSELLSGTESAAEWPDSAAWDAEAAAFRTPEEADASLPVTVNGRVPLVPYGETLGPLRRAYRRLVRKSILWYAEPLIREQNRVNRALLREIEELRERVRQLEAEK